MTLDIEFDGLTEGINALPEIFESHPSLNIIIISGKLSKAEVSGQLFRFTKDNVLKGKRWARHFDVLDKKDTKTEALRRAYSFSSRQRGGIEKLRDLFLLAESYIEKGMIDKCLEVYQKIQSLVPNEPESRENITLFQHGLSADLAHEYYQKGEKVIASLLLGHHIENQLKAYTAAVLGASFPALSDCFKALDRTRPFTHYKKGLFQSLLRLRNKAIHQPAEIEENDFSLAQKSLKLLEETLLS
jgi:tetratricopeptide (TPR) repeat protein